MRWSEVAGNEKIFIPNKKMSFDRFIQSLTRLAHNKRYGDFEEEIISTRFSDSYQRRLEELRKTGNICLDLNSPDENQSAEYTESSLDENRDPLIPLLCHLDIHIQEILTRSPFCSQPRLILAMMIMSKSPREGSRRVLEYIHEEGLMSNVPEDVYGLCFLIAIKSSNIEIQDFFMDADIFDLLDDTRKTEIFTLLTSSEGSALKSTATERLMNLLLKDPFMKKGVFVPAILRASETSNAFLPMLLSDKRISDKTFAEAFEKARGNSLALFANHDKMDPTRLNEKINDLIFDIISGDREMISSLASILTTESVLEDNFCEAVLVMEEEIFNYPELLTDPRLNYHTFEIMANKYLRDFTLARESPERVQRIRTIIKQHLPGFYGEFNINNGKPVV